MSRRMQILGVAVAGVGAVTAYAVLAASSILVWNPLAAVPGRTLAEIKEEMSAAGESLGEVMTIVVLGIGVALAVAVAVVALRSQPHPAIPALCYLGLLAFGGIGYFVASFGAGMGLADTFLITGAPHLPAVLAFYTVSALAAGLLTAGVIYAALRRSARRSGFELRT